MAEAVVAQEPVLLQIRVQAIGVAEVVEAQDLMGVLEAVVGPPAVRAIAVLVVVVAPGVAIIPAVLVEVEAQRGQAVLLWAAQILVQVAPAEQQATTSLAIHL